MTNSKKRCRHCKEYSTVAEGIKVPLGFFCGMDCVVQHGKKGAKAVSEKRKKETLAKLKESVKTASEWRTEAQSAFNAYVRYRDRNKYCISCDSIGTHEGMGGYWDAGHYRSRGAAKHMAFNLHNCHKQCHKCNRYLSGNVVEYRKRLIMRIGSERVNKVENNNDVVRHDIAYLKRVKSIFTRKLRIKKRLS
jgi:IS1 family transposase